ncbi:MAG: hypothetical protein JSV88_07940 [Candidatus Aminicenantes bacterium]|nr:MAG: hypothetical protein JSV88_07940 [Candidatus Aminicenantes bacterium]
MEELKRLFNQKIVWKRSSKSNVEFIAYVDGEESLLRINDFPDEPFFTLIIKGNEYDFDDAPKLWEIPYNE